MMRTIARLTLLLLVAGQALAAEVAVPPPLRGWEPWVLHGSEALRCPVMLGRMPGDTSAHRCVWPGRLQLSADAHGATFSQGWQVYAESWVQLPGNAEHWPQEVRIDGQAAAVLEHEGLPQLWLAAGNHQVSGRFAWSSRPERLDIAGATSLVDLRVDGLKIAQPDRPNGALSFGRSTHAAQAAGLDVQVYRLLTDEIPARLETHIRLKVSGDAREELLAVPLPESFTPLALDGDLPARIDSDGRLRVQVRAGEHELQLAARGPGVAGSLRRPAVTTGTWPATEIWSFAAVDQLRVANATGPESVDPSQVDVPGEWRAWPAFRMDSGSVMKIEESQRGLAHTDENRLALSRELWLDFDHGGYTARDLIQGTMRRDWRLDMAAPFSLESAQSGEDNLLVTDDLARHLRGIELRAPQLALQTTARLARGSGAQPATGWSTRFDGVSGVLNMPPGHRLLAAIGPDEADGTWWSGWGLWSLFGVLVLVVATLRLAGWPAAVCALLGLVLCYQEWPTMVWLWLALLVAIALAAVVPDGKLRRFLAGYRMLAFGVLALALLPFCWWQIRYALYPQLEAANMGGTGSAMAVRMELPPPASMPPPEMNMQIPMDATAPAAAAAAASEDANAPPPPRVSIEAKSMEEGVSPAQRRYTTGNYGSAAGTSGGAGIGSVSANANIVQRYAAGTALQAGPGIPRWSYLRYSYHWSGPVEPADQVHFIFIGPWLLGVWRIAGVVLLVLWLLLLAQRAWHFNWRLPAGLRLPGMAAPSVALLAAALLPFAAAPAARADSTAAEALPDASLLAELGRRLNAPPGCTPDCASLMAARINANGERVGIDLDASALAPVALPIPSAGDRWQIDSVTVDGGSGITIRREADGSLWVPLRAGAHRIHLEGHVAASGSVQLAFPSVPHVVGLSLQGWSAIGINDGHLIANSVELTRLHANTGTGKGNTASERGADFPAFVRVQRDFSLGLDWTVATTVQRVAPANASINVEVPLVNGESVLTPGIKVRGGSALAGIGAGADSTAWQSTLRRGSTLALTMAASDDRTEVWTFSVNPEWHVEFSGLPAVLPADSNAPNWLFTYYPRKGESLTLAIARPKGAAGSTLAIDEVEQHVSYGARSANAALSFVYRSTQGGRQVIDLPVDATVESVSIDGNSLPLRPEQGKLPVGLLPGNHTVSIAWRSSQDVSWRARTPAINLNAPASNITSSIELPADRWVLFSIAGAAGVGPAVLYWGELVAFVVFAWALGRWRGTPIGTRDCLLLGLGLSTQSWLVFALVIAWFLLMNWRRLAPIDGPRWRFNAVQWLLGLYTAITFGSLVFSGIRYGLFSTPDMGVRGGARGGFDWFRDRVDGALPQPTLISVPMWIYKVLIFAWALWVAAALLRWLRWGWQSWSAGGYWRGRG